MVNTLLKIFCSLALLLNLSIPEVNGQVITEGEDSVVVRPPGAPMPFYKVNAWSDAGKAALFSAVVPGLGQAYNKSYWKIPVIYVGGGALGYFLYTNHKEFLHFRQAVRVRTDSIVGNENDRYASRLAAYDATNTLRILSKNRDQFRRWRDYTVLYSILFYGLNITEAYVYAHLKDFDISDELSMQVRPNVIQASATKFIPAFTFSFNLKN